MFETNDRVAIVLNNSNLLKDFCSNFESKGLILEGLYPTVLNQSNKFVLIILNNIAACIIVESFNFIIHNEILVM